MTHEGPGSASPEETPAPLASTRWTEEEGADDGGLMPPFIPGVSASEADAAEPGGPVAPAEPAPSESSTADPESVGTAAEPFPFGVPGTDEPQPEQAGATDDFPYDAFDLSDEPEADVGVSEPPFADAPGAGVDDAAERLEDLARRLRSEGPAAAESALGSGDRLTALLAGVLAGYLAGRG